MNKKNISTPKISNILKQIPVISKKISTPTFSFILNIILTY